MFRAEGVLGRTQIERKTVAVLSEALSGPRPEAEAVWHVSMVDEPVDEYRSQSVLVDHRIPLSEFVVMATLRRS
jgi:hypothetical protein